VPSSQPVLHAVNVIARALIPVFGILFLGWSGGKVLLVYLADTLGSMYAVSALAAYAAAQTEPEFQAWIKDGNAQDLLDALEPRDADPIAAPEAPQTYDGISRSVLRHLRRQARK